MFHWDLPQSLETRFGGWRSRRTVDAFARYADTVVKAFGDRVKHWFTLNEIIAFTRNGYGIGRNAPGLRESAALVNQTYHHALLAHGHGVRAVREHGAPDSIVGLVDNPRIPMPLDEQNPADVAAARQIFIEDNIRVLDPLHRAGYTDDYRRLIPEADRPVVEPGDFDLISRPTDFLGLNVYAGFFVRAGADGKPERLPFPTHYPMADSDWYQITPQALYWCPRWVADIYGADSIYIAENGCGYDDEPVVDGEVLDLHRVELLRNYLGELRRAMHDGVPVDGYFQWSFMDNFEWGDGYRRRFGIVHVDYATQVRTPKLSARWYARVIAHADRAEKAPAPLEPVPA
jgi:beta-glucosidase